MRHGLVERLCEMIAIATVNPLEAAPTAGFTEEPLADYLGNWMLGRGFTVHRQEVRPGRCNLIGVLRGSRPGPRLMLAGHLDTVGVGDHPELLVPRVSDDRVYGRGSCDMKGAFACYMAAVEQLQAEGFDFGGELYIAGVADEEYRMLGAKHLGRVGPEVDWVVVGEPTSLEVRIASRGRVVSRIVTRGVQAHSSAPEKGVNAIYGMGPVLLALHQHSHDLLQRTGHPLLGAPRLNVGMITGGTQSNIVPDRCEIEVDRRTLPGESLQAVHAELEKVLERVRAEHPGLQVSLEPEPVWVLDSLDTDPSLPVVRVLLEEAAAVTGRQEVPGGFPAGTDAPYFGAPAVICGPGSIRDAHSADESVGIEELEAAAEIYKRLIRRLLGSWSG